MTGSGEKVPFWVDLVMRGGYVARGLVNVLLGLFALAGAWRGSRSAEGAAGAMRLLMDGILGVAFLAAIAAGLAAYAVWRFVDGWLDIEDYGTGSKGIVARGGMVLTGLVNLALAGYAVSLIWTAGFSFALSDDPAAGRPHRATGIAEWIMSYPFGKWIVVAIGAAILAASGYYLVKAVTGRYKSHLRCTKWMERLDPLAKVGLLAEAAVVGIVGCFFVWAGWTSSPGEAGGIEAALHTIHEAYFGRYLLTGMALGLLCFCLYCVIEAVYRVIPRLAGPDLVTLADKVSDRAAKHARRQMRRPSD